MLTWKVALPLLAALLGVAVAIAEAVASERSFGTLVTASGCTFSDGQLICGKVIKKKHRANGGAQPGDEARCPPGTAAGLRKSGTSCATQAETPEQAPAPAGTAFECRFSHGKLVCGKTTGTRKTGGGDQVGNENSQGEGNASGERSCPPGYVVLAEKNKYGAFCEPRQGFPTEDKKGQPDNAGKAADACIQAGLKYAGAGSCSCGVGLVNTTTGLSGANPGEKCVSVWDYNKSKGRTATVSQIFDRDTDPYPGYEAKEYDFRIKCVRQYKSPKGASCISNPGTNTDTCTCEYTK